MKSFDFDRDTVPYDTAPYEADPFTWLIDKLLKEAEEFGVPPQFRINHPECVDNSIPVYDESLGTFTQATTVTMPISNETWQRRCILHNKILRQTITPIRFIPIEERRKPFMNTERITILDDRVNDSYYFGLYFRLA